MTDQRRAGWLRRRVRSSARLTGLARGVRLFVQGPPKSSSSAARPPASPTWDRIPELRTIEFRASSIGGDRLNLIVPTVQPAGVFGGVRTALDLFTALAEGAPKARIISLGPTPDPAEAGLPGYVRTGPADDSDIARSIVSLGDPATELAVGPGDVFVATYWTTAELTQRIRAWQATAFGGPGSPMVYLIQDYEPGFYPWSAQFLLARGTYADPSATLAIFNSKLLQDYLHGQGLSFRREFVFEPRLAEPLRRYLPAQRVARPRRILVYGRPKTPRNAFPLIVDGLRAWAATDPGAPEWSVVSIGQSHPDIDLGAGLVLSSRGKLSMDEYGALLSESAIGVSLMVFAPPKLSTPRDGPSRDARPDQPLWRQGPRLMAFEHQLARGRFRRRAWRPGWPTCAPGSWPTPPAASTAGRLDRTISRGPASSSSPPSSRALLLERRPPEVG